MADDDAEWRRLNRANWDERVAVHLGPKGYDLNALGAGRGRLRIVEDELGPVDGLRVLHLQCHVGTDSWTLAQCGATVVGVDFSPAAVAAATALADELGLADRARFVVSDVYDAPDAVAGVGGFDCVFASSGTICWLPDVCTWAEVVARCLRPGGFFYFAEGHPVALVLDDAAGTSDNWPGLFLPYLAREMFVDSEPRAIMPIRWRGWRMPSRINGCTRSATSSPRWSQRACGSTGCTSMTPYPGACSIAWWRATMVCIAGQIVPGCRWRIRCGLRRRSGKTMVKGRQASVPRDCHRTTGGI